MREFRHFCGPRPKALRAARPRPPPPGPRPARRGKPRNGPHGGVPALDAKRKGCLRVRPSLRVPFPTRRSGDNAEVPASASRARQEGPVPCTARSGRFRPVPHGPFQDPFHQSLRIFFLKFQHLIFIFSPHPAWSTPQPRFARQPPCLSDSGSMGPVFSRVRKRSRRGASYATPGAGGERSPREPSADEFDRESFAAGFSA